MFLPPSLLTFTARLALRRLSDFPQNIFGFHVILNYNLAFDMCAPSCGHFCVLFLPGWVFVEKSRRRSTGSKVCTIIGRERKE